MADINLIPKGAAPKSTTIQTASNLKLIAVVGTIALIFSAIVITAIIVINASTLNTSLARQEQLKTQIGNLKTEETKYLLVKDRAVKIGKIWDDKGLEKELQNLRAQYQSLPPEASLNEADLSKGKSEVSFSVTSSRSLTFLFANLVSSGLYSGISMTDFTFDPESGYQTGFIFTN